MTRAELDLELWRLLGTGQHDRFVAVYNRLMAMPKELANSPAPNQQPKKRSRYIPRTPSHLSVTEYRALPISRYG